MLPDKRITDVRKTLICLRRHLNSERRYRPSRDVQKAESCLEKAEGNLFDAELAFGAGVMTLVEDAIADAIESVNKFLNTFGGFDDYAYC